MTGQLPVAVATILSDRSTNSAEANATRRPDRVTRPVALWVPLEPGLVAGG